MTDHEQALKFALELASLNGGSDRESLLADAKAFLDFLRSQ